MTPLTASAPYRAEAPSRIVSTRPTAIIGYMPETSTPARSPRVVVSAGRRCPSIMVIVARVPSPRRLAQTSVPWLPCWLSAPSPHPLDVPRPSFSSAPQQMPSKGVAFEFTPSWNDWSKMTSPTFALPDSEMSAWSRMFLGEGRSKLSRRIYEPVTSTSSISSSSSSSAAEILMPYPDITATETR